MSDTPIIDALNTYLEAHSEGYQAPPELQEAADEFEQFVAEDVVSNMRGQFRAPPRDSTRDYLWGSQKLVGGCHRQHYFSMKGYPQQDSNPRLNTKRAMGVPAQHLLTYQMILAGVPLKWEVKDRSLTVGPFTVSQRFDILIAGEFFHEAYKGQWTPWDVKGKNSFGYDVLLKGQKLGKGSNGRWKRGAAGWKYLRDHGWGEYGQIQKNIAALDAPFGGILAYHFDSGNRHEVRIPRDNKYMLEAHAEALELEKHLASETPPEKPSWATEKSVAGTLEIEDNRCSYCPYRRECFPGVKRVLVSGQVKWRRDAT